TLSASSGSFSSLGQRQREYGGQRGAGGHARRGQYVNRAAPSQRVNGGNVRQVFIPRLHLGVFFDLRGGRVVSAPRFLLLGHEQRFHLATARGGDEVGKVRGGSACSRQLLELGQRLGLNAREPRPDDRPGTLVQFALAEPIGTAFESG